MDNRQKSFEAAITLLTTVSGYPEKELQAIKSFWEGHRNGYAQGRESGYEEGYAAAMKEATRGHA